MMFVNDVREQDRHKNRSSIKSLRINLIKKIFLCVREIMMIIAKFTLLMITCHYHRIPFADLHRLFYIRPFIIIPFIIVHAFHESRHLSEERSQDTIKNFKTHLINNSRNKFFGIAIIYYTHTVYTYKYPHSHFYLSLYFLKSISYQFATKLCKSKKPIKYLLKEMKSIDYY